MSYWAPAKSPLAVQVEEDGRLKIIDRKKDLVKLQFGEWVKISNLLFGCQARILIMIPGTFPWAKWSLCWRAVQWLAMFVSTATPANPTLWPSYALCPPPWKRSRRSLGRQILASRLSARTRMSLELCWERSLAWKKTLNWLQLISGCESREKQQTGEVWDPRGSNTHLHRVDSSENFSL